MYVIIVVDLLMLIDSILMLRNAQLVLIAYVQSANSKYYLINK